MINDSFTDLPSQGSFHVPVGPPQFGCWRATRLIENSGHFLNYAAQPTHTPNHSRSDYLLRVLKTDLPSEDREAAIDSLSRRVLANEIIDHHGVLPILDAEQDHPPFYTVEPLVEARSLSSLHNEIHNLGLSKAVWLIRQIAEVLAASHAMLRAHLAIHAEHVMLDPFGKVFVAGWGSNQGFGEPIKTSAGALAWPGAVAPELHQKDYVVQPAADVHALGAISFWIVYGRWPSPEGSKVSFPASVPLRPDGSQSKSPPAVPLSLVKVLQEMLSQNPLRRPRIHQVLERLFAIEIDSLDAASSDARC